MHLLTRVVRFSAAHRYHRPEWSDEENRARFGACNNPHGHGHNYSLEVTVQGSVDPLTGFAVDLAALDALLRREVTERFDHRHLNHDVPEFASGKLVPTCENILDVLWPRIEGGLQSGESLARLRLREDASLWVERIAASGFRS